MATAAVDTPRAPATLADRIVDACRQAAHLTHEAHLVKSITTDAVEDGVYVAQRALKTARRRLEDAQAETVHRVKRHPLEALGMAVGVGFVAGLALGWIAGRASRCRDREHVSWLS
jgi:ElaB/YqjD/DUF883 family membrane-anchored ribosome-binding protein